VHIVGDAVYAPHVLPVPLPAERRNIDTDFEHLAGHLTLEVTGRLNYRGETDLAGLEIGTRTPAENVGSTVAHRAENGSKPLSRPIAAF
jgi:hypothetical protein